MAPTYITTVELQHMPATDAVARIFQYNVIHRTPHVDAILKRHAIMIMSGYHQAAMLAAGEPPTDKAFVEFICKLMIAAVDDNNNSGDRASRIMRKLFGATTNDKLQANRLIKSCRPELHARGYGQDAKN
jgi:hypothetical protein